MSTIPTYWIPLVPVTANDGTGEASRRLQRTAMLDEQSGAAIPPLGRLLSERDPLLLYD